MVQAAGGIRGYWGLTLLVPATFASSLKQVLLSPLLPVHMGSRLELSGKQISGYNYD